MAGALAEIEATYSQIDTKQAFYPQKNGFLSEQRLCSAKKMGTEGGNAYKKGKKPISTRLITPIVEQK